MTGNDASWPLMSVIYDTHTYTHLHTYTVPPSESTNMNPDLELQKYARNETML